MNEKASELNMDTDCVHSTNVLIPPIGYSSFPIVQNSTFFRLGHPLLEQEYEYSRSSNPTRRCLELNIANLEKAQHGFCFSSGVAAIQVVASLLNAGDEVILQKYCYLGTSRIFEHYALKYGIKIHQTDFSSLENLKNKLNDKTKLIWIETPTNPLLRLVNIKATVKFVRNFQQNLDNNIIIAADNTFATPFFQNPLFFGVDIVVHSASKYLGGHSDAILGAIVCNDIELAEKIRFIQNSFGAIASPFDSFLVLRGVKTLHLRMARHNSNAISIVNFLLNHNKINNVHYPSLSESKKDRKQMSGFGGIVSFDLKKDTISNAITFLDSLKIFKVAESLGGVESLATSPASFSHKNNSHVSRLEIGISNSLVRLSVGIESERDLISDISKALQICN